MTRSYQLSPQRIRRHLRTLRMVEVVLALVLTIYLYYKITGNIFTSKRNHFAEKPLPLFTIPKRSNDIATTTKINSGNKDNLPDKCSVTVAIILCEDDRYLTIKKGQSSVNLTRGRTTPTPQPPKRQKVAKDFSRQINQTLVLLKSIAILTEYGHSELNRKENCVEVLLLSDKPTHYNVINEEIQTKWSPKFRKRLKVTDVPVHYPSGSSWMKNLFRPCATLRLFLADLLPKQWESVLYLDTDVIFFQSVQTLWKQFQLFDEKEGTFEKGEGSEMQPEKLAAMAPCLVHYGTSANSVPFYGTSGLNAGIMLMNLTRMRSTQWTNKIRMVTTMFKNKIKLADQDILNIYFHFFPEQLHLLSCDWNFRPFQCRSGSYCEDPAISQGISALHGNALSFTPQGPEPLFHSVFQSFHRVKLNEKFKLRQFVEQLESSLLKVEESVGKFSSQCKRFGGLDVLLLSRLYGLVENTSEASAYR